MPPPLPAPSALVSAVLPVIVLFWSIIVAPFSSAMIPPPLWLAWLSATVLFNRIVVVPPSLLSTARPPPQAAELPEMVLL